MLTALAWIVAGLAGLVVLGLAAVGVLALYVASGLCLD